MVVNIQSDSRSIESSHDAILHFIQFGGRQRQDDAKMVDKVRGLTDTFLNSGFS
jgi:hypothetical protein